MDTSHPAFEYIGTVDVWELRHFAWPVLRAVCRQHVERRELRYYQRQLLSTQRWAVVRCVPQPDVGGGPSSHVFDVYGATTSV